MKEYEELIKALRYCSDNEREDGCDECPYLHNGMCRTMLSDAAYALEAADEKIADYTAAVEALDDSNDAYINRIAELEAQLPKEGEWIVEEIDDSGFKWCKWRCSVCREVVQKGWQHTKDGEKPKWKYCPNCGADGERRTV